MKTYALPVFVMTTALAAAGCASSRAGAPIARSPAPPSTAFADSLPNKEFADIEIVRGGRPGDLMGATRRRQLLDTLMQQQRRWDETRPAEYRIRVVSISDCMTIDTRQPRMWARSVVRDTLVVGREMEPIVAQYDGRCLRGMRAEDLFRELAAALVDTTQYVHDGITYDAVYGFPRSYWISSSIQRGGGTLVETFIPVPQSSPPGSRSQQRDALIQIEREIAQANFDCNYRYFELVEAAEFTFTGANGAVSDRKEDLAGEATCKKSDAKATIDSTDVRLYGTTAVVVARSSIASTSSDGKPITRRSRFTDVFVWRDGRWQLVAGHSSRLP